MNAPYPRSSGVSGSGTLPDQKACSSLPTGSETGTQFCRQNEENGPDDNRSYQFRACGVKIRAKKGKVKPWMKPGYITRSEILALMKKAEEMGINLDDIPEFTRELKRTGVLLNQVVKLAHQDRAPLDYSERVMASVKVVEAIVP